MNSSNATTLTRLLPCLLACAAAFALILVAPGLVYGQAGPDAASRAAKETKAKRNWSDLSEAEKQKLREALRTVWSDPRVVSARENVNRSAREYREAIQLTLASLDPESARLASSLEDEAKNPPPPFVNGNAGKGKRPGLEHFLNPPPFLEKLSDEQKQLYFKASATAHAEPQVQAAWEELKALNREDEEMRHRKFEALRKYRSVYLEAIVKAEPQLVDVISLLEKEREKNKPGSKGGTPPR